MIFGNYPEDPAFDRFRQRDTERLVGWGHWGLLVVSVGTFLCLAVQRFGYVLH